ncbi:MAG: alpha/beta fold hydrolase [Planctomycetota bacterium]
MTRIDARPIGLSIGALAGLAALAASCALPPQSEELPLTAELPARAPAAGLERRFPAAEPEATSSAPRVAAERDVQPQIGVEETSDVAVDEASVADPLVVEATNRRTGELERAGPEEASVDVDLRAIERDVDAPPTSPALIVPTEVADDLVVDDLRRETEDAASSALVQATESVVADPAAFVEGEIETAEGRLMPYSVGGTGSNVIFIHGWCGNAGQWEPHARSIAESHRVYTLDLPGHGESVRPVRDEWTVRAFGRDVAQLIEKERLTDVVLVGHAMGAQVALETAALLPERILAIIGVDALQSIRVDPNPESLKPWVARFEGDFEGSMEEFIDQAVGDETAESIREEILDDALQTEPGVATALMTHFGEHDPKLAVRTISSRVVCINSRSAPTDEAGNRLLLPTFEVTYIEKVGHWPHLEDPVGFGEKLRRELVRIAPDPGDDAPPRLMSMSPVIFCQDVARVRNFYVDGLDFEEVDRSPRDGEGDPDFVALRRDGVTLNVQALRTLRRDLPSVAASPTDATLFLRVTNLDRELARIGEVVFVEPERRLPSGARQVVFEDPAGTLVILEQPPERAVR